MKLFGIIGYPLSHSLSKAYFMEKIEREAISDAIFEIFPIASVQDLPALLATNPNLHGLAVTIPYKQQVIEYITHSSPEVVEIGAVNCIKVRGNELTAFNTDIIGFEKSFVKHLQPFHKKALVLGTGGASKAVQYVLKKLGIDFLIVSRKENAAEKHIQYAQVTKAVMEEYNIVINSTPLGMSPNEDTCPDIPYNILTAEHYLYDLVYKPAKTLFLQKGEEHGAKIENGFEMLIIQAEENWRIWNEE